MARQNKRAALLLACEQALLFGRAKRAARERASERRSREGPAVASPLACLSRVYFSQYPPNGELARRLHCSFKWTQAINYRIYANKCMFCWNALAGDLTEKQKKIFRENKFYHGYTIPEPKEMVRKLTQQLTFSSTWSLFSWLQLYNFQCCRRKVEPRSTSVNYLVLLCRGVCRGCKHSIEAIWFCFRTL